MGYAAELGNYAEYSGAPNEEEVLRYARVLIDVMSKLSTFSTTSHYIGSKVLKNVSCVSVLLQTLTTLDGH